MFHRKNDREAIDGIANPLKMLVAKYSFRLTLILDEDSRNHSKRDFFRREVDRECDKVSAFKE